MGIILFVLCVSVNDVSRVILFFSGNTNFNARSTALILFDTYFSLSQYLHTMHV